MSNWRASVDALLRQYPRMTYHEACSRVGRLGALHRKKTKWKMRREEEARARMERMGLQ